MRPMLRQQRSKAHGACHPPYRHGPRVRMHPPEPAQLPSPLACQAKAACLLLPMAVVVVVVVQGWLGSSPEAMLVVVAAVAGRRLARRGRHGRPAAALPPQAGGGAGVRRLHRSTALCPTTRCGLSSYLR